MAEQESKNRHYVLVIQDSRGQHISRFMLLRQSIDRALAVGTALVLCLCAISSHALMRLGPAQEATALAQENRRLSQIIAKLDQGRPGLLELVRATDQQAEAVAVRSGLGLPGQLEPVVDANDGAGDPAQISLETPAEALGDGVSRLMATGQALQRALDDTLEYFNDARLMLSNTPSIRPARTPWVTSSFGKRRDPIFGYWVMHKGLDMGGHIGMRVSAPADGVVIWTGRRGGYGVTVVLDHGYGLQTHFAHLSRFLVRPGDHVRRGEPIAEIGSTGKSTGPHLHYEVRRGGEPMDPRRFILD